jgi:tRNA pseudouridine synthase 10
MPQSLKNKEILKIAKKSIKNYELCDSCFGRNFYKLDDKISNKKRGEKIRKYLKIDKKISTKDCWLCSGLINEIPHFAELISNSLGEYEFDTFLVGVVVDEDIIKREKEIFEFNKSSYGESIKNELKREIGKILEKELEKNVDFKRPTIMAIVDTSFDNVNLQFSSLYIYGKYKKYSREIPQTRWFCKICRGKGCKRCNYTGKIYKNSVEGLIAKTFLEHTQGDEESLHGSGREDVDVRMLGQGRPFVLEIKNPKIRNINLAQIKKEINEFNKGIIEVNDLKYSDKDEVIRIKKSSFNKTYRVIFKSEKPINSEKLKKAIQALRDSKIRQFTPSRVAHRRANMVREKYIYTCNLESIDGSMAILTLETESGTYIKELVSGDDGRTEPSISELIGVPCKVTELDVIEIKGE